MLVVLLTWLNPAIPVVRRTEIVIDSVRRGNVAREVRGPGTLVPEQTRWITSQASARVERLVAQSGQAVAAGEVLLELSNPDLSIQTMQAEQQVRQAQIDLINLRTNLRTQLLAQEGLVATTVTQHVGAMQQAEAADSLIKGRLIAPFEANVMKAHAAELTTRLRVERERLNLMKQAVPSQVAVQGGQVAQLQAIAAHQQTRLRSLQVRAPEAGVLQDLTLQLGQWVPEGATLAKVVQPGKLKAVLRIPESQAKDVRLGQTASIDTRNGIIPGRVARKDPAAQSGTVTIDVELLGPLPAGAVPDLSIDGVVEVENLDNVMYMGRPVSGAATGTFAIFKLLDGGSTAKRVPVVLGRTSVNAVEILRGLKVGDKVILSDMGRYDDTDRVRIK